VSAATAAEEEGTDGAKGLEDVSLAIVNSVMIMDDEMESVDVVEDEDEDDVEGVDCSVEKDVDKSQTATRWKMAKTSFACKCIFVFLGQRFFQIERSRMMKRFIRV